MTGLQNHCMHYPGAGIRTAEAVVAYVDDINRFAKATRLGTYFGLVPCQDASASVNRLGHITREGPATVRKMPCEAAWQAIHRQSSGPAAGPTAQAGKSLEKSMEDIGRKNIGKPDKMRFGS
jgi:transposase